MIFDLTLCAGTRDSLSGVLEERFISMSARLSQDLAQVLEIESSRRCADTRKQEKYDRNKVSSRSAEKILGSEESTAKIKKVYNLTTL